MQVKFDDPRAVADAGLLLPATLAEHLGLRELFDEHVDLGDAPGRANVGHKAMTLIHSALAGGDCLDDADALRAADTVTVLGHELRAPSTLGTFVRSFTWGHVRQLDRVAGTALARAWSAGAGPDAGGEVTVDVDSTVCETYGLGKQGAKFSYSYKRGYHPLIAVVANTSDVVGARLRGGNAHSGRGAAGFVTEAIGRVRAAGADGQVVVRADSGFYNRHVTRACTAAGARFSITAKLHQGVKKAIETINEDAWTPIPYWLDGGAEVAETPYRPAGSTTDVRLIVRRVKPTPGSQLALFTDWSYHPFVTNRPGDTMTLEADHRRHADIENVIRDLKYGVGLNHFPSGRFAANGVWLALNVLAYNLARWVGRIATTDPTVTVKTLRRRLLRLPGRITRSGRRQRTLHLPSSWPWAQTFTVALDRLRAIPPPAAT